jgi:hypothetical protein
VKAATNPLLLEELEAARIAARSFIGADETLKAFMGKAIECLMNEAMQAGPGAQREVLMEKANGIRLIADKLNEPVMKQPETPSF